MLLTKVELGRLSVVRLTTIFQVIARCISLARSDKLTEGAMGIKVTYVRRAGRGSFARLEYYKGGGGLARSKFTRASRIIIIYRVEWF